MARLDFALEVITPAFNNGARWGTRTIEEYDRQTRRNRTELVPYFPIDPLGIRIPSLRGVLQFWWRALNAHEAKETDCQDLLEKQGRWFGSTKTGQGLRIVALRNNDFQSGKVTYSTADRFASYLGYGPLQLLRTERGNIVTSYNKSAARDAILTSAGKEPIFSFRAFGDESQLAELRNALMALHLFGGIGARSRRGFGSLNVTIKDQADAFFRPAEGNILPWFQERCSQVLTIAQATTRPPYTALSAQDTRIRILFSNEGRPFSTPDDVLRDLFSLFGYNRIYKPPPEIEKELKKPCCDRAQDDHDASLNTKKAGSLVQKDVPGRLAYGMPYASRAARFGYRGVRGTEKITRRSSPLFLKVLKVGLNRYVGVAALLWSNYFRDSGFKIEADAGTISGRVEPPGPEAILEFLNDPWFTVVT